MKTDVLLLADIMENFRGLAIQSYELDPANYFNLPSFSFDACLKMTKVKLELLLDSNMYQFIEQNIRGGVSTISKRYARANNCYCKDFNAEEKNLFLILLDYNNLYGTVMTAKLPIGGFKWLEDEETKQINWLDDSLCSGDTGYILEVDLDYPKDIHSQHNCYPCAPEKNGY